MSCSDCNSLDCKDELLITCDKCKRKLCQICAKLSATEYRAASLKSERILLYLCPECKSSVDLHQSENTKLDEVQKDLQNLSKKLTDLSKTTLQIVEKMNENISKNDRMFKTLQKESQILKDDIQSNIERTKQEVTIIKETNKDMIRLLSNPAALPKPQSGLESHANKQSSIHQPPLNKVNTITREKPSQQKLVQHNSTSIFPKNLNSKQQTDKSQLNKSPAAPKQYSEVVQVNNNQTISEKSKNVDNMAPKKQNSSEMEKYQQKLMNDINYLEKSANQNNLDPSTENENWRVIQRKRHSNKRNIGQSEDNSGNFKGINQRVWIYLYKIQNEVTEKDIQKYITTKINSPKVEFTVKQLQSTNRKSKCFVVAADFKYKETFYTPSFWPKGVCYRRFDFKLYYEKFQIRDIINGNILSTRNGTENTPERNTTNQPNSFLDIAGQAPLDYS